MKYFIPLFIILLVSFAAAECIDSDTGKNKYEFGTVTQDGDIFEDRCVEESIKEYFCSADGTASYATLQCAHGCEEGECILANKVPRESAEYDLTSPTYMYLLAAILILGIYIYWFWIRRKRKRRY